MTAPALRPVARHPALLLPGGPFGPTELAVADLHLGLGAVGVHGGGLAGPIAEAMADELLGIAAGERARGVVVVGDVKHPIVGAPPPVGRLLFGFFSRLLDDGLEVRVIPGNHDAGLARHLPREVELLPVGGLLRGPVGLFHGHAHPAPALSAARTLVVGHLHPGYRLAPGRFPGDGKQRCWIRSTGPRGPDRLNGGPGIKAREVIVLPAFNPISGIEPLNDRRPAAGRAFLLDRYLAPGRSRAYLLDGADLGELSLARGGDRVGAPRPVATGPAPEPRRRRGSPRDR